MEKCFSFRTGAPTNIDNVNIKTISVSPNPAKNILMVQGLSEKTTYKILDLNGKIVTTGITDPNSNLVTINQLNTGAYFLVLDNLGKVKFIKE
jgi:hypothetical protein